MQSPTKTLLLALLALVASVAARPGGAPACAINEQRITAGMGEPQGDRSFRLEASATEYTPGQPLTMKVTSTNAATRTYKGILLYVQPAAAANQRVGKFTIPQGHKDNTGPCAGANIQAEPESVLTQSSSDDKPLGADIVWTPPANADGDMVVRAVIVGAGPRNWQVLENVTLKKRGGEQPAQGGNNNGNMRRVCKKWRKVQPGAGGNAGGGYGGGPSPTQPAGQQPTQTTGQGATGSETPAPAPPADGQAPPAPPAEGQAPPADGQAPPAPPADGQAPPAPPADGQAPPAPPADGQAPPAPADGQAPPPGPDGQAAAGQVQENNTASNSASGMRKNVATGMAAAVVAVVALAF